MTKRPVTAFPAAAISAAILVTALHGAPRTAEAVPRYSARYEQNCNLCHENPTGGGIRSTYASQWLVPSELSMKKYSDEEMAKIAPQLSEAVTVGLDYRTQLHWETDELESDVFETSYENFFQMEGNLYVSVAFDKRFSAHATRGMSSTSEIYGLAYVLPANGWVKVGRFVPPYGWRLDDHTAFIRGQLGFMPPGASDVGIEVGVHPGRLQAVAAILNGNPGSTVDNDDRRAYSGYALYRANLGGIGLGLGGSAYWNKRDAGERLNGGPLWYLKAGRFTWTGEVDWSRDEGADSTRTAWVTSNELAFSPARGVDILATYDFYDPDVDLKGGTRVRYGVGAEITPRPFLTLHGMVTLYRPDVGPGLGPGIETDDFTQVEMQVHLFY